MSHDKSIRQVWVGSGPGVEGLRAPFPMARSGQRARFGVRSGARRARFLTAFPVSWTVHPVPAAVLISNPRKAAVGVGWRTRIGRLGR